MITFTAGQKRGIFFLILIGISLITYRYIRLIIIEPLPEKLATTTHLEKQPQLLIDLNNADTATLEQLKGIGPVLSRRILRYRNAIGGFDSLEMLRNVYGLSPETYKTILPSLCLSPKDTTQPIPTQHVQRKTTKKFRPPAKPQPITQAPLKVNINTADSAELIKVYGIGAKTSIRIIKYRRLLGFYYALSQLKEVYGLSEENYDRMAPYLTTGADFSRYPHVRPNEWEVGQLGRHPYIDFKAAKIIHAYRTAHGPFKDILALKEVKGLEMINWEKLEPYLVF